ncbi:MAG: serine hydrolase [Prochlorothrix sp.]|nr:serine hydrolase [Prochlorothrix sp.]
MGAGEAVFFQASPEMADRGDRLCHQLQQAFPSLKPEQLALTWLVYDTTERLGDSASCLPRDLRPHGYSYRGLEPIYPASVVKLFYLVAYHQQLADGTLAPDPELERAVTDMIVDSSNDATGYVMDVLTGTTSGPPLVGTDWEQWQDRRNGPNRYFASWGWPEWAGCSANQKTWCDGPYGRERAFLGLNYENRNYLNSQVSARLFHSLVTGAVVSPAACGAMLHLMRRSLDPDDLAADPENQVTGFLGAGVPRSARVWSKAGLMSRVRHDAAYVEFGLGQKHNSGRSGQNNPTEPLTEDLASNHPDLYVPPFLLVIFTEGREHSENEAILPHAASIAVELLTNRPRGTE